MRGSRAINDPRRTLLPPRVRAACEPWRRELLLRTARVAASLSFDAKGRPRREVKGLSAFLHANGKDGVKGDEYLQNVLAQHAAMAGGANWGPDAWLSKDPPVDTPPARPAPGAGAATAAGVSTSGGRVCGGGDGDGVGPVHYGQTVKGDHLLGQLANTAEVEEHMTPARRRKKRRKRDRNPFVEALRMAEGKKSSRGDEEFDDLEDFIVCKPGRDYKRLLGV